MAGGLRRNALGWLLLVFLLAGCSSSRRCQNTGPSGPGSTASDTVLSMALDHSVYAPGSEIPVTLTNLSGKPVSVVYQCQEVLIGSPRDECQPKGDTVQGIQSIAVPPGGATYLAGIVPQTPGTYRLVVRYVLGNYHPSGSSGGTSGVTFGTVLASQPVRVCTCGTCP